MTAVKGKGATLAIGANSIGQLVSVGGPSMEVGTVESTDLSSSARTFVSTITDGGEVSFTINYDSTDTEHAAIDTLMATPSDSQAWTITLNDSGGSSGTTIAFTGICTNWELAGIEVDGLVQAECSVKVSGAVTVTAAS